MHCGTHFGTHYFGAHYFGAHFGAHYFQTHSLDTKFANVIVESSREVQATLHCLCITSRLIRVAYAIRSLSTRSRSPPPLFMHHVKTNTC